MAPRKTQNSNKKPNHNKNKSDNKKRMLIDASKHEETRVAVAQHGKLEDFEVESLVRRQIKGNIYLAKVTRVEPSLQAAFVNYGGNRHGFLPFSEIHPDYYRIPVADRERLMAEQEELEKAAAEEAARIAEEEDRKAAEEDGEETKATDADEAVIEEVDNDETIVEAGAEAETSDDDSDEDSEAETSEDSDGDEESDDSDDNKKQNRRGGRGKYNNRRGGRNNGRKYSSARNKQDRVSDEDDELSSVEPFWKRMRKAYKIQEVIKRGQIMLIQVGKEERGNKGAAVTTYITLPGRYCVLMPNTPQSGGVSRKIANYKDRKRMREILKDLNVPDGMSVILRTAGTTRTKAEIKRDMDYLMRLWNNARDLTLKSTAPALINEEGSLIKRAIRDIYNKDIDEVIVAGKDGYKTAHDMMKMLMPSHAKKVHHYKDDTPLFIAEKLEKQIEAMHSPQVELKSGGYLVINPTEALISIDVNSGRATKERNIDDTALRTNIEAAQEIARQLKLRDLGGLVVIDFIDMEKRSFNGKVERAMRDALAGDRARIQIGRISSFGLMEMSRQRLHPSLTEAHFEPCPKCHGMGIVKTVDTMALTILRAIEESAIEQRNANVTVTVESDVALYLFNHHRRAMTDLEDRYGLNVEIMTGSVDNETAFDLISKKKTAEELDNDNSDNQGDDENGEEDSRNEAKQSSGGEEKSKSRSSRGRGRKTSGDKLANTQEGSQQQSSDNDTPSTDENTSVNSKEDDKPKTKKRGRPAKKKIEIVEENADESPSATSDDEKKSESKPKAKAKPKSKKSDDKVTEDKSVAATNDNTGDNQAQQSDDDINAAAREAETVNEAPKKKKKGWWNKITS
jgi:ribonuclease E